MGQAARGRWPFIAIGWLNPLGLVTMSPVGCNSTGKSCGCLRSCGNLGQSELPRTALSSVCSDIEGSEQTVETCMGIGLPMKP